METLNELNDWEWQKFKHEFDIINWDTKLAGARLIGVALVGFGRMGLVHMRNLLKEPRARLLYCFDADQARLDACSRSVFFKELNIKALQPEHLDLALNDPQVHAVVIAAPTAFHYQLVKRSLEAGKSVMCEKPLSTDSEHIMPLYELAASRGVFLVTAFNRHHDSDWIMMRRQLTETTNGRSPIGSVQLIRIVSRNGQRPSVPYLQVSGGCFHDTCIHDFGMMLWLRRKLPVSIQVVGKTWQQYYRNEPDLLLEHLSSDSDREAMLAMDDDYFLVVVTLKFSDGSLGVIDMARHSGYGNDQRCEIFGSRGTLKCDGRLISNVHKFNQDGDTNPGIHCTFVSRYGGAYAHELESFLTLANVSLNVVSASGPDVGDKIEQMKARCKQLNVEYPSGSLVAAATKIADTCRQAVNSGRSIAIDWGQEFELQFSRDLEDM